MHKKSRSIERDFVGFAYRHFDGFGFLFAIKSVISDKLAYALVLPSLAGLILISQGVILGKRKRKVIDELTAGRHGVVGAFLIVAVMLFAAALKVICSAYLENEIAVPVDIMTDIQKLFRSLCRMLSPLSGRADRGYPPLSLLAFRLALLHKRQFESFTAYHKGNLSFLVRDGKVRNIKVTVVFHELRKLRNNTPLSCVRLALSLGKLVCRGRFPRSRVGILLCGFQLIRRQVIFRFFTCFYCLIIGENILRFFLVWKNSLDTLKAFSICYSLGDNNHSLSFGGERGKTLSPWGQARRNRALPLTSVLVTLSAAMS